MDYKVVSLASYKPHKGQVMDPRSETEQAGYIPADVKITSFLEAGMRLQLSRADQFDYDENYDGKEYMDETRRPGYDMADAFQDSIKVNQRLKERGKQNVDLQNDKKGAGPAPSPLPPDGKTEEEKPKA